MCVCVCVFIVHNACVALHFKQQAIELPTMSYSEEGHISSAPTHAPMVACVARFHKSIFPLSS